jgi:hypothetical protein
MRVSNSRIEKAESQLHQIHPRYAVISEAPAPLYSQEYHILPLNSHGKPVSTKAIISTKVSGDW